RRERSAAVEVLAQLSAALRRPALALAQARDQVQRPGELLLAVGVAKSQRVGDGQQLLALIGVQLGGPAGAHGPKQSGVVAAAGSHLRRVCHHLPSYAYG